MIKYKKVYLSEISENNFLQIWKDEEHIKDKGEKLKNGFVFIHEQNNTLYLFDTLIELIYWISENENEKNKTAIDY